MSGEEIRAIRKRLKLTQVQFAEKLGVKKVTVIRWENGHFKPSLLAKRQINRLARKG